MPASRRSSRLTLWAISLCLLAALAGCSGGESESDNNAPETCDKGSLDCACYGNRTCDDGLVCTEGRCLDPEQPGRDAGTDAEQEPDALTVQNVRITPVPAYNDSVLRCEAEVAGPGSDQAVVGYLWQRTTTGAELGEGAALDLRGKDLAPGSVMTCRVVATHRGERAEGEVSAALENRAPRVDVVTVTPPEAQVGTEVRCDAQASDPDGSAALDIQYAWSTGAAGPTYVIAPTDAVGSDVTCTATARDLGGASASGTAGVVVLNTAPVVESVQVSPAEARVGDWLSCDVQASDANLSELVFTYTWSNGAADPVYQVRPEDRALGRLGCAVVVADPDGSSAVLESANEAQLLNSPPVVTQVSVRPSAAVVGETVTCEATVSDADGTTPNVRYAWSNGVSGPTFVVTATNSDPGQVHTCTATAWDAEGAEGVGTSIQGVLVRNSPPVISSVTISPAAPRTNDTLVGSVTASDPDGSPTTIGYTWTVTRAGTPVVTRSQATLPGSDFERGDVVNLVAEVHDGEMFTSRAATPVTILNSAPTTPAVSMTPATPEAGDALTCQVATASTDADQDPVRYRFAWLKNGVAHTEEETAALSSRVEGVNVGAGETWSCRITALDGQSGESGVAVGEVSTLAELPRIRSLSYTENTVGCPTSNCGRAISVNVVVQRMTYARNGSGPSYGIEAADAQSFTDRVMTDDTYERMRNGFDCPSPTTNETEYRFEGSILVDGEYRQSLQDISGCVEAQDEHVLAIIEVFEELRTKYYPPDINE